MTKYNIYIYIYTRTYLSFGRHHVLLTHKNERVFLREHDRMFFTRSAPPPLGRRRAQNVETASLNVSHPDVR